MNRMGVKLKSGSKIHGSVSGRQWSKELRARMVLC